MYYVQVYGITWEGRRACCQYSSESLGIDLCSDPTSIAVDFATVLDFRIVYEMNAYETMHNGIFRRIDTFTTLRGFRHGMTPRRFERIINL